MMHSRRRRSSFLSAGVAATVAVASSLVTLVFGARDVSARGEGIGFVPSHSTRRTAATTTTTTTTMTTTTTTVRQLFPSGSGVKCPGRVVVGRNYDDCLEELESLGVMRMNPRSSTFLDTIAYASVARAKSHGVPRAYGVWLCAKKRGGDGELDADANADADADASVKKQKQQPKKPSPGESKTTTKARSKKNASNKGKNDDGGEKKGGGGKANILELIDPFKAGQKVRRALDRTVETAVTTLAQQTGAVKSKMSTYYLDDRLMEPGDGPVMFAERNPLFDRLRYGEDAIPEVLVVGATGEVGRIVVRRLLLDGRFRVRVLVRDLYSDTLNLLGTGVTYCRGDLSDVESLEYAVTDVDKIVFCAGAPRPDEDDFRRKFQEFSRDNLVPHHEKKKDNDPTEKGKTGAVESIIRDRRDQDNSLLLAAASAGIGGETGAVESSSGMDQSDEEWQRMRSILEVRSRLAEQIDFVGMRNLVRAYQNVRHADYGTSQAAKRSMFKFQKRPGDFDLFSVEGVGAEGENGDDAGGMGLMIAEGDGSTAKQKKKGRKRRKGGRALTSQCAWIRNKFGHGVFVGRVPTGGGEASIVSGRLSSRDNPQAGIDLTAGGFGGFVARVCSDGGRYEAFVRTGDYDADGTEYVCEFNTGRKPSVGDGISMNQFVTVRLPFSRFRPVRSDDLAVPAGAVGSFFDGSDVRQIGFRFKSGGEEKSLIGALSRAQVSGGGGRYSKFYLALSYIKVYRNQPEPEFVYVSDAKIPPVVGTGMVRHDAKRIVAAGHVEGDAAVEGAVSIFDEEEVRKVSKDKDRTDRSSEETYYKYRGEEVLRHSGLSYTIIRIAGFDESATSQSGSVCLQQSGEGVSAVTRADVAQVCVSALLDPDACNTVSYLTKGSKVGIKPGLSFSHLLPDS